MITVAEFNETYKGKYLLLTLKQVTNSYRYALQEWCPGLNQWAHKLPKTNILVYRNQTGKTADGEHKVPQWVFDQLDTPSVILDIDEYGTQIYSAMNTEQATLAMLQIMKNDRYRQLLQYRECEAPGPKPTREAKDFADNPAIQNVIEDQWVAWKQQQEDYNEYVSLEKDYDRAIQTNDGLLAYEVCQRLGGSDDKPEFKTIEIVKVPEHAAHIVS